MARLSKLCGLVLPLTTVLAPLKDAAVTFWVSLHVMHVALLATCKLRDQQQPALFPECKLSNGLCAYPCHQLIGPLPWLTSLAMLSLTTPTTKSWLWELSFFMTNLLRWLPVLHLPEEPGTVTFLELAFDFEESRDRTLLTAPQAHYIGHTLSLQECARVLRVALCSPQKPHFTLLL